MQGKARPLRGPSLEQVELERLADLLAPLVAARLALVPVRPRSQDELEDRTSELLGPRKGGD